MWNNSPPAFYRHPPKKQATTEPSWLSDGRGAVMSLFLLP